MLRERRATQITRAVIRRIEQVLVDMRERSIHNVKLDGKGEYWECKGTPWKEDGESWGRNYKLYPASGNGVNRE